MVERMREHTLQLSKKISSTFQAGISVDQVQNVFYRVDLG